MKRAMGTVLAATALVLMGSDGAVRSDCPPVSGSCPPLAGPLACIWFLELDGPCNHGNLANCECNSSKGECSSDESHVALNSGYVLLLSRARPEGCCANISPWGFCFQFDTRPCYKVLICEPLIMALDCDENNPCGPYEVGITNMTGWFTSLGSQCCVDSQ